MIEHTLAEGAPVPYRTRPSLWSRLVSWLRAQATDEDIHLPAWEPRYRYSPGMEKPDARFHAVPGAVARKREIAAKKARSK